MQLNKKKVANSILNLGFYLFFGRLVLRKWILISKVKYKATFTATIKCVWLKCLLAYLGIGQTSATTILANSQSTLIVARNSLFHAHTKNIGVHYHYVKERFSTRNINLAYVPTQDNLVGLFTKALPHEEFEAFCKALGLLPFVD